MIEEEWLGTLKSQKAQTLSADTAILVVKALIKNLTDPSLTPLVSQRLRSFGDQLHPGDPLRALVVSDLAKYVAMAVPVVWNRDIWNAAIRDADKAFPQCRLAFAENSIPSETHLWLFSGVHGDFSKDFDFGFPVVLQAVFLHTSNETMSAALFFLRVERVEVRPTFHVVPLGSIKDGEVIDGLWASFIAGRYFLSLKLASVGPHLPHNKNQLRRLRREHGELPEIRVVTLRSRESGESSGASTREHNHQWIVSGHWRRQWYPSQQINKPIYIEPHIKGPEGKPMMPIRKTIFKATR